MRRLPAPALGALLAAAAWAPAACGPASVIFGAAQDIDLSVQREMTVTGNWDYTPDEDGLGGVYKITGGEVTVSGTTTSSRLVIAGSATVTLKDASIVEGDCPIFLENGVSLTLVLSGRNILRAGWSFAGIQVPAESSLTITTVDGSGSLDVSGGTLAAGIGNGAGGICGAVTIKSGTVTAEGGFWGAGIGGGLRGGLAGPITITGGTVKADSGEGGAGIGTGGNPPDENGLNAVITGEIIITGGYVIATGWNNGAGIGGGYCVPGGIVSINYPSGTSAGKAWAKTTDNGNISASLGSSVGAGASDGATDLTGGAFYGPGDTAPDGVTTAWPTENPYTWNW
ncbi:MAG: hypothetical protein MdMp014T_0263 [Treponematales bacterium]